MIVDVWEQQVRRARRAEMAFKARRDLPVSLDCLVKWDRVDLSECVDSSDLRVVLVLRARKVHKATKATLADRVQPGHPVRLDQQVHSDRQDRREIWVRQEWLARQENQVFLGCPVLKVLLVDLGIRVFRVRKETLECQAHKVRLDFQGSADRRETMACVDKLVIRARREHADWTVTRATWDRRVRKVLMVRRVRQALRVRKVRRVWRGRAVRLERLVQPVRKASRVCRVSLAIRERRVRRATKERRVLLEVLGSKVKG